MPPPAPAPAPIPLAHVRAPASWRAIDFISDLHLHPSEPETFDAWRGYMARTPADAILILGDLFEVWVGDDAASEPGSFESTCAQVLAHAASRAAVYFMHGNRDFLVGGAFLSSLGVMPLHDPAVLEVGTARWLLSHGDLLCLDDVDYLEFRAQVRGAEWQRAFLARPLAERRAVARDLRAQSEARKRSGAAYADVDAAAAADWLRDAGAASLIHGHTHRPAEHALAGGLQRVVLSDWDARAQPPRLQVLRLSEGHVARLPLDAAVQGV